MFFSESVFRVTVFGKNPVYPFHLAGKGSGPGLQGLVHRMIRRVENGQVSKNVVDLRCTAILGRFRNEVESNSISI